MKLYTELARLVDAIANCEASGNIEWRDRHWLKLRETVRECLPSGGGFDSGTHIDDVASNAGRLVFHTSFHHMNADGYYTGWTEHKVIVRPSLAFGIELRVTGRDRNDIKDYIAECFYSALCAEV